ncbi:MAG: TetR family transcriptional regulator [Candidatus Eisenbacteria bacterium]|nr:TetR family transcriptional regulator [Candidatus Eisenbacteria bacterium]
MGLDASECPRYPERRNDGTLFVSTLRQERITRERRMGERPKPRGEMPGPDPPASSGPISSAEGQKRRRLFGAAEPLFARFGFRKTTVEEICLEAGVSKRTFYDLFRDKADCFLQLAAHVAREMCARYESAIAPQMSAPQRLDRYLETYIEAIHTRPVFRQIAEDPDLMRALARGRARGADLIDSVRTFTELVEFGIARGEFRPASSETVTWIVHSMIDALFLLGSRMHPTPGRIESPEFVREVFAFVRHGLGVRADAGGHADSGRHAESPRRADAQRGRKA